MKYSEAKFGRVFVLRLEDGDVLHESIEAFAVKEGVKVITNTKLQTLEFDQEYQVNKAIAISNGNKITFEPKYIIAADGVN